MSMFNLRKINLLGCHKAMAILGTLSNGENFDPQKKFLKKVKSAEFLRKSGSPDFKKEEHAIQCIKLVL